MTPKSEREATRQGTAVAEVAVFEPCAFDVSDSERVAARCTARGGDCCRVVSRNGFMRGE